MYVVQTKPCITLSRNHVGLKQRIEGGTNTHLSLPGLSPMRDKDRRMPCSAICQYDSSNITAAMQSNHGSLHSLTQQACTGKLGDMQALSLPVTAGMRRRYLSKQHDKACNFGTITLRCSICPYDYHQDLSTEVAQRHQSNLTKHLSGNNRSEGAAHVNNSDIKSFHFSSPAPSSLSPT